MHAFVTPLFGKAKVKLAQTPRAVTPFGGLVSFIAFLDQIGYAQQLQAHLPWQLTRPKAIPLTHTLTAFFAVVEEVSDELFISGLSATDPIVRSAARHLWCRGR